MDLFTPLGVITPTVDADVLVVLAAATEPLAGRQVHQMLGKHSERGVRNTLNRLTEQGIVTCQRIGAASLFALNAEHLACDHIVALASLRGRFYARLAEHVAATAPAPCSGWVTGTAAQTPQGAHIPQMDPSETITVQVRPDTDPADPADPADTDTDASAAGVATWDTWAQHTADRVRAWTGNPSVVELLPATAADPVDAIALAH